MMRDELSPKKEKEQQDSLWNLIYKMKERTSGKKKSKKFKTKNKKFVFRLIKVADDLHKIRDKVIDAFEKKSGRVKFWMDKGYRSF